MILRRWPRLVSISAERVVMGDVVYGGSLPDGTTFLLAESEVFQVDSLDICRWGHGAHVMISGRVAAGSMSLSFSADGAVIIESKGARS